LTGKPAGSLRICLMSSDYLPNAGGIAAHVAGLAGGLARAGCVVTVVVPGATRSPCKAGATHDNSVGFRVFRTRTWAPPLVGRLWWRRAQVEGIRRAVAREGFDVCHWHTPGADAQIASRLPARLRVFTNHTSQFLEWAADDGSLWRARQCLLSAEIVICPSKELADATISMGFPPESVRHLPNGVDTERFHPGIDRQEVRRRLAIAEDEVVFLCPRRLEKKNGVPFWLRAIPAVLAELEGDIKPRFVLIGDYPGKDEYSDRTNVLAIIHELSLGERLQWIGHVPPEEMPKHLAAADVCVLPSLMEATSIAGLEAMACARPLIGTRVGGIPEIVEDGSTGVLVPRADSAALAETMIWLARDPDLRGRMGEAARRRAVSEFGWDAVAARTLALYVETLAIQAQSFSSPRPGGR